MLRTGSILLRNQFRTPLRIQKMPLLTISNSINESLKKHEIFGDVVAPFDPKGLLTIAYQGDGNEVALGNTLKVADTQEKPTVQFTLSTSEPDVLKDGDKFTLVLTDPDAPSRTDKKWSEYAHYISTDISLNNETAKDSEFLSAELKTGADLLPYQGPAPPQGTGKHRYVFILYKQPPGVKFEAPKDRPNWGYGTPATGAEKWSKEHGLEPWAVNFFLAETK